MINKLMGKTSIAALVMLGMTASNQSVFAQLIPDTTLGSESSTIVNNGLKDTVTGGATRGSNLFHSFQEFNIDAGKSVYFANPANIQNILTRVTGNNISNIFGKLGVDGNANLFLINPNGIYFGNSASLDIKGSFTASTASGIKFTDGTVFPVKDTNTSPLLTISVPVGLQWGNTTTGNITNKGNLQVGKNLTLSGKNVASNGILSTPHGQIELTSIAGDVQINQLNALAVNIKSSQNINYDNIFIVSENPPLTAINPSLLLTSEKQITGTGNITTTTPGLLVNLQAKENINIKDINSKGGNIQITSDLGDISTGILDTTYTTPPQTTIIDIDQGGTFSQNGVFTFTSKLRDPILEMQVRLSGSNIASNSSVNIIPYGSKVTGNLITSTGNNQVDFQDTLFDDRSSTPISSGSTPFNGTFQPSRPLAIFQTTSPNVTFNLLINNQGNGGGTIYKAGDVAPWGIATGTQLIITTAYNISAGGSVNLKAGGNISTSNINSSGSVSGGLININANHNITTGFLNSTAFPGNGGNISLNSIDGNITTQAIKTTSESYGNGGNGGSVTMTTGKGNIDIQSVRTFSGSFQQSAGNGGAVTLTTKEGNIFTQSIDSSSLSYQTPANAGAINLTATGGSIFAQDTLSAYSLSFLGTAGNGGSINLTSIGGNISTKTLYSFSNSVFGNARNGGNINLDARDGNIIGDNNNSSSILGSFSISQIGKAGTGGNIILKAKNNVSNLEILTLSSDDQSGTFDLKGFGDLSVTDTNIITSKQVIVELPILGKLPLNVDGLGRSGNAMITSLGNLTFNNSRIASDTKGTDPAGSVTITSPGLMRFNNSQIITNTSNKGQAGNINIQGNQGLILDALSSFSAKTTNAGNAGSMDIKTSQLTLDGGQISAASSGIGKGGNINITANTFNAHNGGQLLTTTSGSAKAGNINLKVRDNITLDGTNTGLFANTQIGSSGDSGSIDIDPAIFIIKNGAGIGVNSQGSGEGGSISITAGTLRLENQGFINAETASNQGGNINLNINDLLWLRNNSQITATAGTSGAGGNGGNINITTPFIISFASENSDITANAFQGNGGNINITTNTIFGLKFQPQQTEFSDITASSQLGLSGQVTINRLDVDPSRGLASLPANLLNAGNQLAQGCNSNGGKVARERNRFSLMGKGGLPTKPDDLFSGTSPIVELVDIQTTKISQNDNKPVVINHQNNQKVNLKNREIQQAQGWVFTNDGKVILTSQTSEVIPQNTSLNNPGCEVFSQ